jgi:hypothetical protein
MRVRAVFTSGSKLSIKTLENLHNQETDFQLEIGAIYTVFGINTWYQAVHYLTYDKWMNGPFWHPAELFEIVDNHLPPNWYYRFYGYDDESMDMVNTVCGYKELALNPKHYFDLIERNDDAMNLFRMRSREIEDFHDKTSKS